MHAGPEQINRIDTYMAERQIPIFYAFYNPLELPYSAIYPAPNGGVPGTQSSLGCRVQTATHAHGRVSAIQARRAPSLAAIRSPPQSSTADKYASSEWRLETFIADEVLRCNNVPCSTVVTTEQVRLGRTTVKWE